MQVPRRTSPSEGVHSRAIDKQRPMSQRPHLGGPGPHGVCSSGGRHLLYRPGQGSHAAGESRRSGLGDHPVVPYRPRRRCLEPRCPQMAKPGCSRCVDHEAARKKIRNADTKIARAVVAAAPVCVCTRACRWHPAPGRPCGATSDLTADHVIPLSLGGTNEGPRQVLCRACNSSKRNRV